MNTTPRFSRLVPLIAVAALVSACAPPPRHPPPRRPWRPAYYHGLRTPSREGDRMEAVARHRASARSEVAARRSEPAARHVTREKSGPDPATAQHDAVKAAAKHPARFEATDRTILDGEETSAPSGDRVYREKQTGRIIGSAWTSHPGTTTYRDADGRITGSSSESPGGRTTHRDSRGRITHTADTSSGTGGDYTTTYRRNGAIVGQKYVSPAGNVTWRDGNGRIISGPDEMKP